MIIPCTNLTLFLIIHAFEDQLVLLLDQIILNSEFSKYYYTLQFLFESQCGLVTCQGGNSLCPAQKAIPYLKREASLQY